MARGALKKTVVEKVTKKVATTKPVIAAKKPEFNPGGTPVGWSFWTTWDLCKRMGFLKYVEGLHPIETPDELSLGSAYHGLIEGHDAKTVAAHSPEFAKNIDTALKLFISRKSAGAPPLPKNVESAEKTLTVPGIPMTSKPDRIEVLGDGTRQIREFKTAKKHYDTDAQKWAVSGEVIGEMMASGTKVAIVDIIQKSDGRVRQIEVKLTPEKASALMGLVESLRDDVVSRLTKWSTVKDIKDPPNSLGAQHILLDRIFPKSLNQCGYQYGKPCPYYERCWSKSGSQHLYLKRDTKLWRKFLPLDTKE